MSKEPIKFTDEEVTQIKELRDSTEEKVAQFGQLKLEKILTQQRLDQLNELEPKLENEYVQLQTKERELVEILSGVSLIHAVYRVQLMRILQCMSSS